MNKHIELVERWFTDNDSVSTEELEANRNAAYTTAYNVYPVAAANAAVNAAAKAFAAANAFAQDNAFAQANADAADAAYWVAKYHTYS